MTNLLSAMQFLENRVFKICSFHRACRNNFCKKYFISLLFIYFSLNLTPRNNWLSQSKASFAFLKDAYKNIKDDTLGDDA